MKKRTVTDDEFINITLEVMKKPPISCILENADGLVGFPLLYSAALCAELFGNPNEEDVIPFETVYKMPTKNYTYAIYHGGNVIGNQYVVRVEEPSGRLAGIQRYFNTLKEAYECIINAIMECCGI